MIFRYSTPMVILNHLLFHSGITIDGAGVKSTVDLTKKCSSSVASTTVASTTAGMVLDYLYCEIRFFSSITIAHCTIMRL